MYEIHRKSQWVRPRNIKLYVYKSLLFQTGIDVVCPFVLLLFVIGLSVLRFIVSEYTFGIFKSFLHVCLF